MAYKKIKLKLHEQPSVFRIVITDKYAYISGFLSDKFGDSIPIYRVPEKAVLYRLFEKYFDSIWGMSREPDKA